MPKQPRLSELPDFLPAAEPGTEAFDRLVFGTFSDPEANTDVLRQLVKRLGLAQQPPQHTTAPIAVPEGTANGR